MREKRNSYEVLMGMSEGKKPPGEPSFRWEDNIIINLREVVWGGMEWIDLAQDKE
jgi:hypothetical protein